MFVRNETIKYHLFAILLFIQAKHWFTFFLSLNSLSDGLNRWILASQSFCEWCHSERMLTVFDCKSNSSSEQTDSPSLGVSPEESCLTCSLDDSSPCQVYSKKLPKIQAYRIAEKTGNNIHTVCVKPFFSHISQSFLCNIVLLNFFYSYSSFPLKVDIMQISIESKCLTHSLNVEYTQKTGKWCGAEKNSINFHISRVSLVLQRKKENLDS